MGTPIPASFPTSSTVPAGGIDDGEPAGHRLDDRTRARILHLCVQQDVCTTNQLGGLALRVAADELDTVAQAELVEQRIG